MTCNVISNDTANFALILAPINVESIFIFSEDDTWEGIPFKIHQLLNIKTLSTQLSQYHNSTCDIEIQCCGHSLTVKNLSRSFHKRSNVHSKRSILAKINYTFSSQQFPLFFGPCTCVIISVNQKKAGPEKKKIRFLVYFYDT